MGVGWDGAKKGDVNVLEEKDDFHKEHDQEDGEHQLPDSKEDQDNQQPLANEFVSTQLDTEKLAMSILAHGSR